MIKSNINETNWLEHLVRTSQGIICNTLGNLELILTFSEQIRGVFRFNEFTNEIELKDSPWGHNGICDDNDLAELKVMLEDFRPSGFSDSNIRAALNMVARRDSYHPVREYLNGLTWDGEHRLEKLFYEYLNTEDIELYRKAAVCTMVKAVQRVMEPGCNCPFVPILIGEQGCGKSSFARILGGGWTNDSVISVGNKDGYLSVQGSWLVEIPEMASFPIKKIEAVKAFVTSGTDRFRPPYARSTVAVKRQCFFVGTTNNFLCLDDATGNRRWWPIECRAVKESVYLRNQWLEQNRDLLWAEAMDIYKNDLISVEIYIEDLTEAFEKIQSQHNADDPLLEDFLDFLEIPRPGNWNFLCPKDRREFFKQLKAEDSDRWYKFNNTTHEHDYKIQRTCVAEFTYEYLGFNNAATHQHVVQRAAKILSNLPGWELDQMTHRYNGHGRKYWNRVQ